MKLWVLNHHYLCNLNFFVSICVQFSSKNTYLRNLSVRVVCTKLVKIHQQMAESRTARGMLATRIWFLGSFFGCTIRRQPSIAAKVKYRSPVPTTRCNIGPKRGLHRTCEKIHETYYLFNFKVHCKQKSHIFDN